MTVFLACAGAPVPDPVLPVGTTAVLPFDCVASRGPFHEKWPDT